MDPQRELEELLSERATLEQFKTIIPNAWAVIEREINRLQALADKATYFYPNNIMMSNQQGVPVDYNLNQHNHSSQPFVPGPMNTMPPHSAMIMSDMNGAHGGIMNGIINNNLNNNTNNNLGIQNGMGTNGAYSSYHNQRSNQANQTNISNKKRVKLPVPADKYPDYNFVGRILGPRGATLKTLERDTGCKIMIRGKGSIRKDKENEVRGKPGWEHVFNEPLHVVVEADLDEPAATKALNRAKEAIELLLVPVPEEKDSLKRQQLRDLAILNGTFKGMEGRSSPSSNLPMGGMDLLPQNSRQRSYIYNPNAGNYGSGFGLGGVALDPDDGESTGVPYVFNGSDEATNFDALASPESTGSSGLRYDNVNWSADSSATTNSKLSNNIGFGNFINLGSGAGNFYNGVFSSQLDNIGAAGGSNYYYDPSGNDTDNERPPEGSRLGKYEAGSNPSQGLESAVADLQINGSDENLLSSDQDPIISDSPIDAEGSDSNVAGPEKKDGSGKFIPNAPEEQPADESPVLSSQAAKDTLESQN